MVAAGIVLGAGALAIPSDEQIARLGHDLTPTGAERAGNADGTIPAWTGGVTQAPPGWKPGAPRPDLFGDDPVLFTIDASNVDRYADRLAPGQVELLRRYAGYRMKVYPTHRSCALPESYYEDARRNARIARVDDDCVLRNGVRYPLFPIPENGCQAIWNATRSQYAAQSGVDAFVDAAVVTQGGDFVVLRSKRVLYNVSSDPKIHSFADQQGWSTKSISTVLGPPKRAGEVTLVNISIEGFINAWIYNPGQRRVRRAPNFRYDNPIPQWDGLVDIDQVGGFVPPMDRYNWTLVGKRELYVPYNDSKIRSKQLKYSTIVRPRYPRPDLLRYELHRVWVVEANVRPDVRHRMPRRMFYIDEDSWAILHADGYDKQGQLMRISDHYPEVIWELPACHATTSVYYDLPSGRYVIDGLQNELPEEDYLVGRKGLVTDQGFTPDGIRRLGRR